MFDAEEVEGQIKRTVDAIKDFYSHNGLDAANADYQISMLKLMLGSRFDELHWFVEAERKVAQYLDKKSKAEKTKQEMVKSVEEYCNGK